MPIENMSIKGYYYLDTWVMSHIINQSTCPSCDKPMIKRTIKQGLRAEQ